MTIIVLADELHITATSQRMGRKVGFNVTLDSPATGASLKAAIRAKFPTPEGATVVSEFLTVGIITLADADPVPGEATNAKYRLVYTTTN